MKLYHILFEGEQLKLLSPEEMKAPKSAFSHLAASKTDYTAPTFALVNWKFGSELGFGLIHVNNFKEWVKEWAKSGTKGPFEPWFCAYAGTTHQHKTDCMGAVEVSYMVRSPQWKGAGTTMYALVSKYFAAPITSDRGASTSDSAKKVWKGIESSSDWKKIELDNFRKGYPRKEWYQFKGSWPNRNVSKSSQPMTPNDESDDCRLPTAEDDVNTILGTASAWMYQGPLEVASLSLNGNEMLKDMPFSKDEILKTIIDEADKLFRKYYTGISG